jgi:hypothetical protein
MHIILEAFALATMATLASYNVAIDVEEEWKN